MTMRFPRRWTTTATASAFRVWLSALNARQGYIDHQVLSLDAYLKFIEDDFLDEQRIDPKSDRRSDSRPTVREDADIPGNLIQDFDFNQELRRPLLLSPDPPRMKVVP